MDANLFTPERRERTECCNILIRDDNICPICQVLTEEPVSFNILSVVAVSIFAQQRNQRISEQHFLDC